MKLAYTIATILLLSTAILMKNTDHGSKQAFADSIRVAGHFDQK